MSLNERIAAQLPTLTAALQQAKRVLLLTHLNPDGDAIGCLLGLLHSLKALDKQVSALVWPSAPSFAPLMPGGSELLVYRAGEALPPHDLIVLMDTAERSRVGRILEEHPTLFDQTPLVILDHHQTASPEGLAAIIEPGLASCAELVYLVIRALGAPLPPDAATGLLLGITSDTQSFQTSSTNTLSHRVAAELLEAGADQRLVVESLSAISYAALQLTGRALAAMQRDDGIVWTTISQALRAETAPGEDTGDAVLGLLRRIADARVYVLFKERSDGVVKISLRANPGVDVAAIARTWGGGGHTLAAGATLTASLAEAERVVLAAVRAALGQPVQIANSR